MNKDKIKDDVEELIKYGEKIAEKDLYETDYEIWYSEALQLVKIFLPSRENHLERFYFSVMNENTSDSNFKDIRGKMYVKSFIQQINIIKAISKILESSIFKIEEILQADLFDNELDTAIELNKKGFVRGAGAISGVVLESHLQQVCKKRGIKIKKKNPTINDLSQLLRDNEIIDTAKWRNIQFLSDIRNTCDHKKEKDPTKDDINELITGVDKVIKTIF